MGLCCPFFSVFVSFANLRVPSLLNRNIGFTTASSEDILIGEVWICYGQFNIKMNEKWGVVQYGFGDTAIGNLYTKGGVSLVPFRTDNWHAATSILTIFPSVDSLIYSKWMGFKRTDFKLEGSTCLIVEPQNPANSNPWIWRTEFFGHDLQADSTLVAKGFNVIYIDIHDM